jgi:sn-1 stearoyl-lipid 9-desaturase
MSLETVDKEIAVAPAARGRLSVPAAVNVRRIAWPYAIGVGLYHLLTLLAFLPWLFSWTGVALALFGLYVFGTLGINLCYHRLLTHRGFECPKWLEHGLAILGLCCFQDSPARWVAAHRRHHQYADEQPDPHSPLVGFFWAHMGWLLVENPDFTRLGTYDRYCKDILRDPFYKTVERNYVWIVLGSWIVFFGGGFAAELLMGGGSLQALQFGASVVLWGVIVRTVLVWHITWSINSVTHLWGYRNYETDEDSRNNILVALLSNGEGWHNNHHADQRSARHGHRWWELDVAFLTLRLLAVSGLARNVVLPNAARLAATPAKGRLTTRGYTELAGE